VHKHDGYRKQVRRVGDEVRLFARRGHDWSWPLPSIAGTATLLRARWFTLYGGGGQAQAQAYGAGLNRRTPAMI
jgi:hypothetical protein